MNNERRIEDVLDRLDRRPTRSERIFIRAGEICGVSLASAIEIGMVFGAMYIIWRFFVKPDIHDIIHLIEWVLRLGKQV